MSLGVAPRRLGLSSAQSVRGSFRPKLQACCANSQQQRSKWSLLKPFTKSKLKSPDTPSASASTQRKEDFLADLDNPRKRQEFIAKRSQASVANNIFEDEILEAEKEEQKMAAKSDTPQQQQQQQQQASVKTFANTRLVLDPDPRSRVRWERKKVMQMVRSNGRLTKEERLKITERQLTHKSEFIPTSVKKLVMLARQVAGKPLDDAITQMKWSKKKMAAEVKYYLEEARDMAIAERGMGLGKGMGGEKPNDPRRIQNKEGKWMNVKNATDMYISTSWVGRGPIRARRIDYKGRGRQGIIEHPQTSISFVLKEEKTRIREYEERKAKADARGPWVHLPNRPITQQRPYYTW